MRSPLPKVLHQAAGEPLLAHVLRAVESLAPHRVAVVVGFKSEDVRAAFATWPIEFVEQRQQLGTGHALLQAAPSLAPLPGPLLVLNGDGPLLTGATLAKLAAVQTEAGSGMTLLSCTVADPDGLGRIVRAADGTVSAVVEHKDASPQQRQIREINPGIYAFDESVFEIAGHLRNDNAAGEYYITDLVGLYLKAGLAVRALRVASEEEVLGVNDQEQLARADQILRARQAGPV